MQLKEKAEKIQLYLDKLNMKNIILTVYGDYFQLVLPTKYMFRSTKMCILSIDLDTPLKSIYKIIKDNYKHVVRKGEQCN